MTTETYEYLTREHGIAKEICQHCNSKEIEVYQDGWAGCYDCWLTETEPKISS